MLPIYNLQEIIHTRDIKRFSQEILGIPLHEGQQFWLAHSTKKINILKPANQWGKTTVEAIKHIYHAVCKPKLDRLKMSLADRFAFRYRCLNFGLTYEVANGVMEAIVEIVEGRYLLPDGTYNYSLLRGFAIIKVVDSTGKLPKIIWWNHSETLIRSYDGLGSAFKRLRLAFVSGDECGDIPELTLFLNGTLMPRTFFFDGSIDLVGTAQPKGLEYEEIAATGEEQMEQYGQDASYFVFSANTFPQLSSVYTNAYMPKESIEKLEAIADPQLKQQIIYGKYVEYGKRLYTFEEVAQAFANTLPFDYETCLVEQPQPNCYYIFSVDIAASSDQTSCTCVQYNRSIVTRDGRIVPQKLRVVYHKAWKGADFSLDLQYQMVLEAYRQFKRISPRRTRLVYDAGSLGGKNTEQALAAVSPLPFPPKGRRYAEAKAEGQMKVKEVLGRNRVFTLDEKGRKVDTNPDWGGIEIPKALKELRRQLEIASKDDDKLQNDQYTSLMQAIHYVEMRIPKRGSHIGAKAFNIMA